MKTENDYLETRNPFQYLDGIDQLLIAGNVDAAVVEFADLLEALAVHWGKPTYSHPAHHGNYLTSAAEVCERGARQWQQILSGNLNLEALPLSKLALNMCELHQIIMGSEQGSLDSYIKAVHSRCGGNYKAPELVRLLLAWCPASKLGINIFSYVEIAPELVVAQAVATVAGVALVSQEASTALDQAIDLLAAPEAIDMEKVARFGISIQVLQSWMRCSYANNSRKHQVKPFLTRYIAATVDRYVSQQPSAGHALPLRQVPDRPVLVLPLESFTDVHAMFRCYADVVVGLRKYFYVVGVAMKESFNAGSTLIFDEFFDLDELSGWDGQRPMDIRALIDSIRLWNPVAIFYLSLGMKQWTIELAQHRLAQTQAMTIGHPASSQCKEIDYCLVESTYAGPHQNYSEQVIELPAPSLRHRLPQGAEPVAPMLGPPSDGIIRIAIPSVAQKLTAGFIAALRYVEERAENPLRFVFMLGVKSTLYTSCANQIRRQLKSATILPGMGYKEYIEEINRCQLHAGTFPFGGTNSLIDSLRQGVPILSLHGDQPHARIDDDFARRAGVPESYICHSEQEYAERLLALVNQPEQLYALRAELIETANIERVFFESGEPQVFAEALANLAGIRGERP